MATVTLATIKRTAVGDRFHTTAKVTESGTYTPGGTPIKAASLGLRYIEQVFLSPVAAPGISAAWDKTPGASVTIKTYDEDNTSGVEAELGAVATTAVYSILAIGF